MISGYRIVKSVLQNIKVIDRLRNQLSSFPSTRTKGESLRSVGCLLLLSGWLIVLAALVLLTSLQERFAFVIAGIAVEVLGLVLLTLGYRTLQRSRK